MELVLELILYGQLYSSELLATFSLVHNIHGITSTYLKIFMNRVTIIYYMAELLTATKEK